MAAGCMKVADMDWVLERELAGTGVLDSSHRSISEPRDATAPAHDT